MAATTGELQRLQNLDSLDHTVELFMGIYGVGKTRAMRWVMQGLRTLKDVLDKGEVNESQRIGIDLYDVLSSGTSLILGFCTENTPRRGRAAFPDCQRHGL